MQFQAGCDLGYRVPEWCTFLFSVAAEHGGCQRVDDEQLTIEPSVSADWLLMPDSGNRCVRLMYGPGTLRLRYRATVTAGLVGHVPAGVLPYLLPSRYCPSDQLLDFAGATFGHGAPGYALAASICDWVSTSISYRVETSNSATTALETIRAGEGVCRDFAHLGIALSRAVNLPARFVTAYACGLEPQDFHAMYEVWLGDRWYLFDPTRHARLPAVVRIGTGRDAADAPFANIVGPAVMTDMDVFIAPVGDGEQPAATTLAVSNAAAGE